MQALPTVVQFGDPHTEFVACLLTAGFFTLIAGLLFYFLTSENVLREDFGANPFKVSRKKALLIVLPLWLLASGWYYNTSFGDRFFALERKENGGRITWHVVYERPHRVREVPDEEVAQWTGVVEMSRRSVRYSLSLKLKNGREIQSTPVHRPLFKEAAEKLKLWGITVPEN